MVRGNWQRRVEKAEERKAASRRKKARRGDRTANRDRVKAFLRALDGGGDEEDGGRSGWSNARGEGGREVHLWVDSRPGGSSKDAAPGASPSAERADKRGSHKKGGKKGDDDDEEEEAHRSPRG
uniref:Uncharacterized protein n=1 Tax=Odontella aurita TaxID=265563 RepID=A0A7S4JW27_9STRA|mmetsp:Transcript_55633/g.166705  ORF Transcript_55633/g.166705 Transcript_55633/m.166705 type:complete len:124 (+) Transcript_55633:174-545(+)